MVRATAPSAALPVDNVAPALARALGERGVAVLTAAPGAGKTTRVPLALLGEPWLGANRIVMLEPRRLAARAAARRMAATLGEDVGETVGYRVRFEHRTSARTRIEVVTDGVLLTALQRDPSLAGVGVLVFDEFHERSLEGDLGLALAWDARQALRPDLRLLVMSATLDVQALAARLGGAAVIDAPGRAFPVEVRQLRRGPRTRLSDDVADTVRRALREAEGSVLAFLPGEAEIRRTEAALLANALPADVEVAPLYGAMPAAAQDHAIAPAPPGRRKVVLATTIAETSLTIEGIGVVVDGGFKRAPRFDPSSGMTRLETVRVSIAAAEQRRGRAGRLGPGLCYRLWAAEEERAFARHDQPEILGADLAPLALELAQWGARDPSTLLWIDPPPEAAFAQARALLRNLGALDDDGAITAIGRRMAALPLHPRLAHMIEAAPDAARKARACDLAALLSERDVIEGARDADLAHRMDAVFAERAGKGVHAGTRARAREAARQIRAIAKVRETEAVRETGPLVALAYPDRVAERRGGRNRYRFAGGGGGVLAE
ncbi:MAG: ATP-dependent helicase HrpB, partial [Alphaproteobacteria bacterium]|nr:ATP-dependent helicase HrpB [Alphaproteobacteria bacterium]